MSDLQENNIKLLVVKRDGKKVDFNGAKIALAIKKGFDSIKTEDGESAKYTEKDVHKVYQAVVDKLEELNKEKEKDMKMYMNLFLVIEKEEHNQDKFSSTRKNNINF